MACVLSSHTPPFANTDRLSALMWKRCVESECAGILPNIGTGHSSYFHTRLPGLVLLVPSPPHNALSSSSGPFNEMQHPSSSSSSVEVERWLESFPDNRWCFRGPALAGDPGAEQRALEERRLDLHKGAVTSSQGLNSNQQHGTLAYLHRGSVEGSCQTCVGHHPVVTCPSDENMAQL